jgi:glycosyltransferase involved in cell wall biosynthesis
MQQAVKIGLLYVKNYLKTTVISGTNKNENKHNKNIFMKICHIINQLRGAGAQNLLVSLSIAQKEKGHDIYVILIDKDTLDYSKILGNKLCSIGVKLFSIDRIIGDKLSFLKTFPKFLKIIKHISPDVINTHLELSHIYGALAACFFRKLHKKHVLTIHNAPEIWEHSICKILNYNKPLIYCSDAACKLSKQKSNNYIIAENGIIIKTKERPTTNSVDIKQELKLSSATKIVISVGGLRPQKNYELLISIARQINNKDIHFLICGGNYNSSDISTELFTNIQNIHLLGLRNDVSNLLHQCDCFLSCSTFEGLPIAVLEAFFSGIPCVLSPIIQHWNIGKDAYSCYFPNTFEINDFIKTINIALDENLSKDKILDKRLSNIEKYNIVYSAEKYIRFYQTLLS